MAVTLAHQTAIMESGLRSAGAVGMTRDELFDVGIANPSHVAESLRDRKGHSIMEVPERVAEGPYAGITTRFTMVVDNDDQGALFEGEATGAATPLAELAA